MTQSTTPTVGMGATTHGYSDSHAHTIIAVAKSGKRITLQRDRATLLNGGNSGEPDALHFEIGGFCAHVTGKQRYQIEPDPQGTTDDYSLRVYKGKSYWVRVGESAKGGMRCTIGERYEHYDFNF